MVLEGKVHLMMKHTSLNLADRSLDAYSIHRELVMLVPDSPRFLLQCALHAVKMGKADEAIKALTSRLGDVSDISDEDKENAAMAGKLLEELKSHASAGTKLEL